MNDTGASAIFPAMKIDIAVGFGKCLGYQVSRYDLTRGTHREHLVEIFLATSGFT